MQTTLVDRVVENKALLRVEQKCGGLEGDNYGDCDVRDFHISWLF